MLERELGRNVNRISGAMDIVDVCQWESGLHDKRRLVSRFPPWRRIPGVAAPFHFSPRYVKALLTQLPIECRQVWIDVSDNDADMFPRPISSVRSYPCSAW